MNNLKLFTSESVSEGHPDKVADQISDNILNEIIKNDKNARVACETFVTTEKVIIGGEVKTTANVNYEKRARDTLRSIGYTNSKIGIGCDSCEVIVLIHEQSSDINQGVDKENEIGAGDQGIMFGFACDETNVLMPLPITISHEIVKRLSIHRKNNKFKYARPDMKSQVTIDYSDENNPIINTVLVSVQHDENFNEGEFKLYIKEIVNEILKEYNVYISDYKLLINPTGRFVIGGPDGDAGLTGRKIIVDTYGGYSRHGGGAFSGKDGTKVDRSAAYLSRYIAKNIVAAKLATKCEVQLSYAIGISEPVSILIETFNTNKIDEQIIVENIIKLIDFTPQAIINKFKLNEPIYKGLATYGHMGREDLNVCFEKTDLVKHLSKLI